MPSGCHKLDPLVTPYIDDELDAASRAEVDAHVRVCPPCHSRLAAERSVRELLRARKAALQKDCASGALRARCATSADLKVRATSADVAWHDAAAVRTWRTRLTPYALAASLVLLVSGAFLYQLTNQSARVMAAELAADHVKCFGLINHLLPTNNQAAIVEGAMAASFGWRAHLPDRPERAGLELVGGRPCLYGEGRMAHLMYRHHGQAVSVFMLPKTSRPDGVVEVLGYEAAMWSADDRTFVLIARESRAEIERLASFVHATIR